jgi:AcrR family transcriptional regulator
MREVAAEAGVSLRLVQYYFHTKEQLLLAALAYLAEQLTERVSASIRALGPVTSRNVVYGTLTAVLPTDEESVRLTRAYTGFYNLLFSSEAEMATRHGATYPDKLESLLARHIAAAQETGEVAADLDPALTAAALLALTNGLGSSVLGGQRDGAAALRILDDQLGRLFRAEESSILPQSEHLPIAATGTNTNEWQKPLPEQSSLARGTHLDGKRHRRPDYTQQR